MNEGLIDRLRILGMSLYEARVYLGLLRHGPQNGNEVARSAGIPSSKVYSTLEKLAGEGIVHTVTTGSGTQYISISPDELVHRFRQEYDEPIEYLEKTLPGLAAFEPASEVLTVLTLEAIRENCRFIVGDATRDLYISIWQDDIEALHDALAAAFERGVRIHEHTRVTGLERRAGGVVVRTAGGATVRADQVVVATSAYSGWLRRLSWTFVPVYDYVLVSEPLTPDERWSVGWERRQALSDANNQFHYFRLTADERILWGGYDAIYHVGGRVDPALDRRPATFEKLEAQFFRAFPQLEGLRFPYRWGGAIDTTTRFTVTFGQTMGGRVTYALGYTGLGVGASRWAGEVVRDYILQPDSERLQLDFVRSAPLPFPPEPFRSVAVNLVRRELDRADRDEGRRGLLLRTLDALGIGFDS